MFKRKIYSEILKWKEESEGTYQLKMNERYIIYTKDMEWKDDILFMPIYMTMCL